MQPLKSLWWGLVITPPLSAVAIVRGYHPPPPVFLTLILRGCMIFFLLEPLKNRFGDVITHYLVLFGGWVLFGERELITDAIIACLDTFIGGIHPLQPLFTIITKKSPILERH